MVEVTFKYRDSYSHGTWNTQHCVMESVEKCKELYGLDTDPDCEYEIISVKEKVDSI